MSEWSGKERRAEYFCSGHIKLCEDVAYIKAKIDAIDKRINGSIDDIKTHIEHGSKWRMTIAGTAGMVILSVIGFIFWAGYLKAEINDNSNEVLRLRNEYKQANSSY